VARHSSKKLTIKGPYGTFVYWWNPVFSQACNFLCEQAKQLAPPARPIRRANPAHGRIIFCRHIIWNFSR
jgi:hypothetical protein